MKEDRKFFGVVFAIVIIGLSFIIFFTGSEINAAGLSQKIFIGMVTGREGVGKYIDWYELKAFGTDVAAAYSNLPDEKERADYRREFFKNLASGFRYSGGRAQDFINWRIYKKEGEKTIVAADYSGKGRTVLFTLSGDTKKKLTAIEWEGDNIE
ncbi:MAG: hypothetical protein NC916_02810 [Candidatus Omnitrophica bacterium]|nr:hypothetical protein [Candidatus Omnitrophota bacterium]